MALVNGTAGNDFIHVAGDGLVAPPGFTDNPGATNGPDQFTPGAGTDYIYCGDGEDFVRVYLAGDINGLAEFIDGGAGNDALFLQFSGFCDLTNVQIINMEQLQVLAPSGDLDVTITAAQFSSFSLIVGSLGQDRIILSAPGAVVFRNENASLNNMDGIVGSAGHDSFDIVAGATTGFGIFAGQGNDNVSFTNTNSLKFGAPAFTLNGGDGDDALTGAKGLFTLQGEAGNDKLTGGKLVDSLDGGNGKDKLTGGAGSDSLTGGTGRDLFIFQSAGDSPSGAGNRDTILDFSHAEGDRLDLSKIDANTGLAGNQAFHLGGAVFTGMAGELIQTTSGGETLLQGDVNGDSIADFQLILSGAPVLVASDFVF